MQSIYTNTRNPILPLSFHVPDGEAHVMPDGKLYIYGSYDDWENVFCSEKYHVVSTADMKKWTFHDVSFEGKDVPWFKDPSAPKYQGIDWTKPTPFILKMHAGLDLAAENEKYEMIKDIDIPPLLFAPDCICRDGKYYLYFCMVDNSEGVAVSDKPVGPFTNPTQLPCGGIDPSVFIDDDGQAYYYWGQLFSHGVKLNQDMISFDETQIIDNLVTEEDHYFHEGSSMRKIGDTYYYVYADMSRGKPTSLGYSTSRSPLGPFTYRGIIIDNDGCDPASWNNHGSIECFQGQWYVFYHRNSRGVQQNRRLCIEKITIQADGSIPEVRMTSQGIGEPFRSGEIICGYQACGLSGTARIDADDAGSEWITGISDGDTAVFRYVKNNALWDYATINARGSGIIKIMLNNIEAGQVVIRDGETESVKLHSQFVDTDQELKLVFANPDELKLISVQLFES
ncbi:MAG TPA: xylosidase [Clostridiales bacterium]|nr:xylosidase [Clostridiales bacterium]